MSLSTYSFTLNGVSMESIGVYVVDQDTPRTGQPRTFYKPYAMAAGGDLQQTYQDGLTITLDCMMTAAHGTLETWLNTLESYLEAAIAADKALIINDRPGVTWTVRFVSEFRPKKYYDGATFTLEFFAANPTPS